MRVISPHIDFINLRKIHSNVKIARQQVMDDDSLLLVSPTLAVNWKDFSELPVWQQFEVRVAAAARSTRKSVLCGFAAATVLGIPHIKNDPYQTQIELGFVGKTTPPVKKLLAKASVIPLWRAS